MLKILADENIPKLVIEKLRDLGHDVVWVRETTPGIPDHQVIFLGMHDQRLLLTFDKDFGELCFRKGFSAIAGIILFRLRKAPPAFYASWIASLIESRDDWSGHFSVVELNRLRMTTMPLLHRPKKT